jgi:hypothetical protein
VPEKAFFSELRESGKGFAGLRFKKAQLIVWGCAPMLRSQNSATALSLAAKLNHHYFW